MKKPEAPAPRRRKGRTRTRAADAPAINLQLHPDAAGIDVGAEEFVAAVPAARGGPHGDVRTFRTFTSGVHELRDWLLQCGIRTAALESTGNYWICLYDTLVAAGIEVCLVNARHVKGVPGRKTDVCDAQWLQQLHSAGLLRKSYRPAPDIVPLRFLMRHRAELCGDASKALQLMQKTLTELNLKLQHVISDIDGASGLAIIDAILRGERDPARLAALRDPRCRTPEADIREALRGDYRTEYLFVLRQSRETWQHLQDAIAACDGQIATLVRAVPCESAPETATAAATTAATTAATAAATPCTEEARKAAQRHSRKKKKRNKNDPAWPVYEEAQRFYGVDLSRIDGAGPGLLAALMGEVGTRAALLRAFPSASAFSSWLGLSPDNRVSGGKILKARTRDVASRLARAFRLSVQGLERSDTRMGQQVRKFKARLGKAEGVTAGAHKLARVVYGVIASGREYDAGEAFRITPQNAARRLRRLQKQALAHGMILQPALRKAA